MINQILEEEVKYLSGERYSHDKPHEGQYSRYGFKSGSVNIGGKKLKKINLQAARSLEEGLEELLTLHKLGVSEDFSVSFSTTNCIESLNSQLKKYVGRVTHWSSSDQRYRWVATALMKIEARMRKVDNFKQLNQLKKFIQKHIHIENLTS